MFGSVFADADVGPVYAGGGADLTAAFGPPSSSGDRHPLHPATGFGASFWLGIGALVLLVAIRHSLPG